MGLLNVLTFGLVGSFDDEYDETCGWSCGFPPYRYKVRCVCNKNNRAYLEFYTERTYATLTCHVCGTRQIPVSFGDFGMSANYKQVAQRIMNRAFRMYGDINGVSDEIQNNDRDR